MNIGSTFYDIAPENPTTSQLSNWLNGDPTIRFKALLTWIINKHHFPANDIHQFGEGSGFVFRFATNYVLKLTPPNWKEEFLRETAALNILANEDLPVAVPKLLAEGEVNGWGYMITNRLEGENLLGRWHRLSSDDRNRITRQSAEFACALQKIDVPEHKALTLDWEDFLRKQRKNCYAIREAQGLKSSLLHSMESYLDSIDYLTKDTRLRLTHADLHAGNFLCRHTEEGWQLCGIIDFGDALYSPDKLFEVNTALLFSGITNASTNALFLRAYGIDIPKNKQVLQDHLMAFEYSTS